MVNINLLPAGQRRQASTEGRPWLYAAGAVLALSLLSVLGLELYYNSQIGKLQDNLNALNGEIKALEPAKQEYDALQTEKADLEKVTSVARELRDQKTYWSNDLAAFTAQLPNAGLSLTSLDMTPAPAQEQNTAMQQSGMQPGAQVSRQLVLNGTANSQQTVIDMLNSFESNPNFGVVFGGMQRADNPDGSESYTFDATVGVAGPEVTPEEGQAAVADGANTTETPGAPAAPAAPPAPAAGGN